MEFQIQQKNLKLEIDISPSVPATLLSDAKRYKQILFNLVGNALKFTFHGSIKLRITIVNDVLITDVSDTGIGIKQEDIDKLFRFFGKINHSGKINQGGMGLGLTISKMILQELHGKISVTSEFSKGTCFSFKIPINKHGLIIVEEEKTDNLLR